jgi:hypothetical protein
MLKKKKRIGDDIEDEHDNFYKKLMILVSS